MVPLVSMLGYQTSLRSLLVAGCVLACVNTSLAQTSNPEEPKANVTTRDPAAAEALFRSGRQLLHESRLEEAYAKFEESYRLDPTSGALFNQGECRLKQGRTASAWALYQQAATLADVQGKPDLLELANSRANQLQADLSYLTFHVAQPVPGLEVLRDGVLVGRAQFDVSLPVDPGRHSILLRAPGYESLELAIVVGEKHDRQTVNVPTLKVKPLALPAARQPARPPVPQAADETPSTWPWVIGAAGATSLVVGTVSGILAIRENHRMSDACPERINCSNDVLQAQGRRDLAANIAWIGIPVGLVALTAATTWLLWPPRSEQPLTRQTMAFVLTTTGRDFALTAKGEF